MNNENITYELNNGNNKFQVSQPKKKKNTFFKVLCKHQLVIFICLLILLVAVNVVMFLLTLNLGGSAFSNSYKTNNDETKKEVHEDGYEHGHEETEINAYEIISVDNVQKVKKLDVLTVLAQEYVIDDETSLKGHIEWFRVKGYGTYSINLEGAEFVVDNANNYVFAKVARSTLEKTKYDEYELLATIDNSHELIKNQSTGANAGINQIHMFEEAISKHFENNNQAQDRVDEAGKKSIEELIKKSNPQVEDLVVKVEYIGEDI